jgi:hypothetical protein
MSSTFLTAAAQREIDCNHATAPLPKAGSLSALSGEDAAVMRGFLPIPVVDGGTLTYERFLREFALPRQPCIIRNLGRKWRASKWCPTYLLSHAGVDTEHKVYAADGFPEEARERKTTVGKALRNIDQRTMDTDCDGSPYYLSAWDYVRGNSGALQEDFEVPRFFERAPAWLTSNVVLGNAATDMKWLYIGGKGTGSATHVDTNLSSAWLWVAQGTKEWVCAHGDDHSLLTAGTGSRAYGYKDGDDDDDDDESVPLPDFFAADLFERWPQTRSARLYRGVQEAGDVCFNPSRCVHAVRNMCERGEVVTSLTHNFVDATNLADVLEDATRTINDDLLPMVTSITPKRALKTLAKTLKISTESLSETLRELPDLASDQHIEELVRCAAAGAKGDESGENDSCAGPEEAVAALLLEELSSSLWHVRPAFESAAKALRGALQL